MTAATGSNEAVLVQRIQGRAADRDAAFAELFATYRARVFGLCRHIVSTRADAEDATQETFLALHRALPSFRGDAALGTFIHRIAIRVALRYRSQRPRDAGPTEDVAALPSDDPFAARQEQDHVWHALSQLSVEHRTVLGLFAVEGLDHREIADVLGIPEGTVWSRLHLARKRLAKLLCVPG
jgi:RNA polymerase sigma-70 factor (ECF subfamily)